MGRWQNLWEEVNIILQSFGRICGILSSQEKFGNESSKIPEWMGKEAIIPILLSLRLWEMMENIVNLWQLNLMSQNFMR